MNKKERKDKMISKAHKCSNEVVASGYICFGCPMDAYCEVNKKFNARRSYEMKEWEKAYYGI